MAREPQHGSMAGMTMMFLMLIVLVAIAIRLFVQNDTADKPSLSHKSQQELVDELKEELENVKNELKNNSTQAPQIIPLDVTNGVYIRQTPRNNTWTVTVRYPQFPLTDFSPAFELTYASGDPWGMMRVAHLDASATDGVPDGEPPLTPYVSFYTLRSSTYYSEGNKGHVFDIVVAHKEVYDKEKTNEKSVFALNGDILITEDAEYAYLYRYKNDDEQVRADVDRLISSFVALNNDSK